MDIIILTNIIIQTSNRHMGLIDFHSHILFDIDDGAKSIDDSISMIKSEIAQGVTTIVLTPHFSPDNNDFFEFLEKRKNSYEILLKAVDENNLNIMLILASEVKFSPKILELDAKELTVGNTDFILIEFPLTHYPQLAQEVFYQLINDGFIPILAHAERYHYLTIEDIYTIASAGVIIQANTSSILKAKNDTKHIFKMVKNNLIHIWGTDTHSMDRRPPNFDKAIEVMNKNFNLGYLDTCQEYAHDILNNITPNTFDPIKPKKRWFI